MKIQFISLSFFLCIFFQNIIVKADWHNQIIKSGYISGVALFLYVYMPKIADLVLKDKLYDVDPSINEFFKNRFKDISEIEKILLKKGSIIDSEFAAVGHHTIYISEACHNKMLQEPHNLEKYSCCFLHEWQHLNNNDNAKNAIMGYIETILGITLVAQQISCYSQWSIKNIGFSLITLPLFFIYSSKIFNPFRRNYERDADKFACEYSSIQELEYFKEILNRLHHNEQYILLCENWWALLAFMQTSDDMDVKKWLQQHSWLHKFLKIKFKYIDSDHPIIEDRIAMINKEIKSKLHNT